MTATLIVGQSGGPTAVINASLSGVLQGARAHGIRRVYGLRHGIEGLLNDDLVDLSSVSDDFLSRLRSTPSAVLGSCRYRLAESDLERAMGVLKRRGASHFVYIGGNDSADTAHRLHLAAVAAGMTLAVIGVPKTIDNDLVETDHCPGYGSAARFIALCTAEAGLDTRAMQRTDPIKLIEVMGRHAGWLAAASWLGKRNEDDAPHLVLAPERPLALETILAAVGEQYEKLGHCVLVLCENQPGPDGSVLSTTGQPRWVDDFGHAYFDSPAAFLADRIRESLQVRTRVDRPGTIQRMSTAHHSTVDLVEAEAVGKEAVRLASAGQSDVMITLIREADGPYRCRLSTAPLAAIANHQRPMPNEFLEPDGLHPTEIFVRYATPLIGEPLPAHARLE